MKYQDQHRKTKILSIGVEEANILLAGRVLDNVSEFCYVVSIVFVLRNVEFSQIKDLARTQNCESLDH